MSTCGSGGPQGTAWCVVKTSDRARWAAKLRRRGGNTLMLTTMMTEEVVTAREAFSVGAARDVTVKDDLGGSLLHVLTLMTSKVLWVEEPLTTRASVRPLVTAKMYL